MMQKLLSLPPILLGTLYDSADFTINTAHGALEGTAKGFHALADMCIHPVEIVQRVYVAAEKFDEFWAHLCNLDEQAFTDIAATRDALV